MAVQFQNGASPFQKPKSFRERFQNLFTRTVSPIPEEEDKRGFLEKVGDFFFPPTSVKTMFREPSGVEGTVKAAEAPVSTPAPTVTPTSIPTPTPKFQPFPTPTLTPEAEQYTAPKWNSLITRYFPNEQVNNALNVMFKESSGNPMKFNDNVTKENGVLSGVDELRDRLSKNSNIDVGLFQINYKWQKANLAEAGYTIEDMLDPDKNATFASWLQKRRGWYPWKATAESLGLLD